MFLLQDEVAHTVTESRVLQNTRHPFLTVRTCDHNHNSMSGKKSLDWSIVLIKLFFNDVTCQLAYYCSFVLPKTEKCHFRKADCPKLNVSISLHREAFH